ncbi:MAG: hypothetical protein AAB432_02665 [Patescibacteria group bacterium]
MPDLSSFNNNGSEQFLTEKVPIGWPWRLLVFAALIFSFSIFVYLGLHFGYQNYLGSVISGLDKNLDSLAKQVSIEDQQKFVNFYSKLANLEKVLTNHSFSSNIFTFLEKNVTSDIYFSNANFNLNNKIVGLKGFSTNFNSLAEQITIFDQAPEVSLVLLKDVSLVQAGSGVNFTIDISFNSDFLLAPPSL